MDNVMLKQQPDCHENLRATVRPRAGAVSPGFFLLFDNARPHVNKTVTKVQRLLVFLNSIFFPLETLDKICAACTKYTSL